MSRIDPSIALNLNRRSTGITSPLESATRGVQLRSALQQYRLNDLAMAEKEREQQRLEAYDSAIRSGGTREQILEAVRKAGLGPEFIKLQEAYDKMDQNQLENTAKELDNAAKLNELTGEVANRIMALPPELRSSAWIDARAQWQSQRLPGLDQIPTDYPGDEQLTAILESTKAGRDRLELARKVAEEARLKKSSDLENQKKMAELQGTLPTEKERNFRAWLDDNAEPMFNKPVGQLTRAERAKARQEFDKSTDPTPKSLQDDDYVMRDGTRQTLFFDPTPESAGYYKEDPKTGKLVKVPQDQVLGKYRQPQVALTGVGQRNEVFDRTMALADNYRVETQSHRDRETFYRSIDGMRNVAAGGPSDIVLLYNFVKLNDPNAAREGELQLVQQGASIPDTWKRYVGKFLTGNVLGPEQRKQMILEADNLYKTGVKPVLENANERYSKTSKDFNVNPSDVIKDIYKSSVEDNKSGSGSSTTAPGTGAPAGTLDEQILNEIRRVRGGR